MSLLYRVHHIVHPFLSPQFFPENDWTEDSPGHLLLLLSFEATYQAYLCRVDLTFVIIDVLDNLSEELVGITADDINVSVCELHLSPAGLCTEGVELLLQNSIYSSTLTSSLGSLS